ncbi:MAG: hypothetical protein RL154_1005 [Pseudomonadota bacterium]|jgi:Cdc6-like AAA superfamily ATPase
MSDFLKARAIFEDENKPYTPYSNAYILVPSLKRAHATLIESIRQPLKIIMLYGAPGSGKTALLNRLSYDAKSINNKAMLLYFTPTFANIEELRKIYNNYADSKIADSATFFDILTAFNANFEKDFFLVLLDEAQLYSEHEMELIRLLADTRVFKFIISLHKLEDEDQLAKAHFQTRIWESIFLKPFTKDELKFFVEKKLLANDLAHILSAFDDNFYKKIHRWTKGNIRESMKFFYKLFDFYIYLDENAASHINRTKFSHKSLEMFAIHAGYIKI